MDEYSLYMTIDELADIYGLYGERKCFIGY